MSCHVESDIMFKTLPWYPDCTSGKWSRYQASLNLLLRLSTFYPSRPRRKRASTTTHEEPPKFHCKHQKETQPLKINLQIVVTQNHCSNATQQVQPNTTLLMIIVQSPNFYRKKLLTYPHILQLSGSTKRASSKGLVLQTFTPSPNIVPLNPPKSSFSSLLASIFTSTSTDANTLLMKNRPLLGTRNSTR